MKILFLSLLVSIMASLAYASCETTLEKYVGWTIVASKTIEGYKDRGKAKKDDFEGCDFDRVVYFTDGTAVTCNSYGYQYAYMPRAIILGKSVSYKGQNFTMFKMIVGGNEYDVH